MFPDRTRLLGLAFSLLTMASSDPVTRLVVAPSASTILVSMSIEDYRLQLNLTREGRTTMEKRMATDMVQSLSGTLFPFWTFTPATAADRGRPHLKVTLTDSPRNSGVWIRLAFWNDRDEAIGETGFPDAIELEELTHARIIEGAAAPSVLELPDLLRKRFGAKVVKEKEQELLQLFMHHAPIAYDASPHPSANDRMIISDVECCLLNDGTYEVDCLVKGKGRVVLRLGASGDCSTAHASSDALELVCSHWWFHAQGSGTPRTVSEFEPIMKALRQLPATLDPDKTRVLMVEKARGSGCGSLDIVEED
jgi:hypothetical protein